MPTTFGQYYHRFFSALLKDVLLLWRAQVIGVILAFAILLLQIHYGVIPKTLTFQAVMSLVWPYGILLLGLIAVSAMRIPVLLDRKRQQEVESVRSEKEILSSELVEQKKSSEDKNSGQVRALQEKIRELEDAARINAASQLVDLSVSLRTEQLPKAILMGTGQDSFGQSFQVHVSEMTLLIYNHGEKPVVLRGCKLWKLHATQQIREISLHEVATSSAPVYVNVTEPLVRVISDSPTLNFSSLQGKYSIRIVITYRQGSTMQDAEPRDFQLICKPWKGTGTLRIDANEIPVQQS
jgi:hypothetical protein